MRVAFVACVAWYLGVVASVSLAQDPPVILPDTGSIIQIEPSLEVSGSDRADGVKSASGLRPTTGSKERRASKPAIDGQTFVDLDRLLQNVYAGRAPQTLNELRALEAQQSKVAANLELVTVNVRQGAAQGSGVIIAGNFVLTAAHVGGRPNQEAKVLLSDGTELRARVLGMNRNVDAGLLKILDTQGKVLPYATIGQSSALKAGQWVVGAGHPGGWQAGRGAVIRVGRISNVLSDTLLSDVALIGGDSGGPLFNLKGELVGIHSRIGTEVSDNMHVPIDTFEKDWDRLKSGESWGVLPGYRPLIGVAMEEGATQAVLGEVSGPALEAGLKVGDVVVKFEDRQIETFQDLQSAVLTTLPGDTVRIEVMRQGKRMRLWLRIGVAPQ